MIHISKILKILPSLHFNAGHSHSIQSPSTTTQSKRHRSQLISLFPEFTWYSALDSHLRKLSTVLAKNPGPHLTGICTLSLENTPPPPIFSSSFPTHHWVLDAFRQRNIFCLASLATKSRNHGPLKAPAVFSSQPVWNAVAAVPLWPVLYGTAPLQRRDFTGICAAELGNDQRILLSTSNKSSSV